MTSNQLSAVSRKTPAGLPKPVAIFARIRLSPMPTEQCRPVARRTESWMRRATCSGSSASQPTKASSQPRTSTTVPSPRSASITCSDAAPYASWSTGSTIASGTLRTARRNGMPEPTPNARASYDAVETTARSPGSPRLPTITGLPASSGRRRTSTATRNWSRSTCSTHRKARGLIRATSAPIAARGPGRAPPLLRGPPASVSVRVTHDEQQRETAVQIDKEQILELLRSRGEQGKADEAGSELPDTVDTDRDAGLLGKYGIDVQDLLRTFGGDKLGGLFGG